MTSNFDRIPAFPLIANDPYFSIWLPADSPVRANTVHWSGDMKPIKGLINVDGKRYRFLGKYGGIPTAKVNKVKVTPTRTMFSAEAGNVQLDFTFWTPVLPNDLDVLSTPITFVDYALKSVDKMEHNVTVELYAFDSLCYDGNVRPAMVIDELSNGEINIYRVGQKEQKILCHSSDRVTIDWGYLYVASSQEISHEGEMTIAKWNVKVTEETAKSFVMLGYDDISSINYFGKECNAWFMRDGATLLDAIKDFNNRHNELLNACINLDEQVIKEAYNVGEEDYILIVSAAWRQTFAAHKLISTSDGEMAFLSKENDSCGCIGTADVSYPSTPIFLKYCPELVNAMCKPILEFASMPVWNADFAPHDVGRYPYATGQMYAFKNLPLSGEIMPNVYEYSANADCYDYNFQMPIEECGNMLIMLETALTFNASNKLVEKYLPLLDKWANYLLKYGEEPENQLCTDDFAGHLARNANLAAKAVVGVACYGRILLRFDRNDEAEIWNKKAHEMADKWLAKAKGQDGTTLTLEGEGWSLKYNWVWDYILNLNLLPKEFYKTETNSYLKYQNRYGIPLDSRADYTKSDWLCWIAAMADDNFKKACFRSLADFLQTTINRVPFSDWYDTVTGDYMEFIARSVQGGLFMPILANSVSKN